MKHKGLYITLFVMTVMLLAFPAVQQHGKLFKFKPLHGVSETIARPELTVMSFISGAYQAQENQYLSENIGFRELFVRYYNQLTWSLFRKSQNKTIYVNDDNWIFNDFAIKHFYGQSMYDYGESSEAVLQKMKNDARMVYQLQEVLKEYGISFFVCLAPEKDMVCAEHVPKVKGFDRPAGVRAIDVYPSLFDSLGVNYLDFSKYYLEIKDTVSYPLYLKSSSHWSNLAVVYTADTLFHYMEALSGFNLHDFSCSKPYFDKTRDPDADLEKVMNLLWPIETGMNYYADVSVDDDSTAVKPRLLTVGDSYYWGFQYNFTLDDFFDKHPYWYYNNIVQDDPLHKNVAEVDILRALLSSDIVMLIYSPCNLFDLNRHFLTNSLFSLLYEDGVAEDKTNRIKQEIKNNPEWYASIEQKALNSGQDVERALEDNARYMLYGSPGLYFDEFNGTEVPSCRNSRIDKVRSEIQDPLREKYRRQIYGNQKWLDAIRLKAKDRGIKLEESIEKDIDWIILNKTQ